MENNDAQGLRGYYGGSKQVVRQQEVNTAKQQEKRFPFGPSSYVSQELGEECVGASAWDGLNRLPAEPLAFQ